MLLRRSLGKSKSGVDACLKKGLLTHIPSYKGFFFSHMQTDINDLPVAYRDDCCVCESEYKGNNQSFIKDTRQHSECAFTIAKIGCFASLAPSVAVKNGANLNSVSQLPHRGKSPDFLSG